MKYDYEKAAEVLASSPLGEKIFAYQQREQLPLDSAIDDAEGGRLGGEVAAYAQNLPSFWVAEEGDAAREAARSKALEALRLAQASLDAAVIAAYKAGRIQLWVTNAASGIDYLCPTVKADLDSALNRIMDIYRPLLAGTGWETNPKKALLPQMNDIRIEEVIVREKRKAH